jgi:hypothetical protein
MRRPSKSSAFGFVFFFFFLGLRVSWVLKPLFSQNETRLLFKILDFFLFRFFSLNAPLKKYPNGVIICLKITHLLSHFFYISFVFNLYSVFLKGANLCLKVYSV